MRAAIVACTAGLMMAGGAIAQEHPEHPKKATAHDHAKASVIHAVVTGENICLGCTLKKEQGAAAQCSKFGHRHALRVTAASADGSDVAGMNGWILHYLATDTAKPFIEGHDGETLTLKGKVYPASRTFEVEKQEKSEKPKKSEHPEHPKG